MPLHNVAFYSAVFFMAGIALASFGISIWIPAAIFMTAVLMNLIFLKKKWLWFDLISVVFIGFFYFIFYNTYQNQNIPYDRQVVFSAEIVSDPSRANNYQHFDASLKSPYRGKVHVYAEKYPEFHYGDLMGFSGKIVKSPSAKINMVGFPKIELVKSGGGNPVKAALFRIKDGIVANLQKVLPADEASLAAGLLVGERADFSDPFKDAMKKSGTTHIVALSGYNIMILSSLLMAALSYVISRRKAFYISIVAIVLFVIMTGAEASVVRAGFMGVIALVAEQSSRRKSPRNAIALTAFIMLVLNPNLLIFDAGFQLSFLALLGIIYIEPYLRRRFGFEKDTELAPWLKSIFQTISAQIAVAPVALVIFGYLSPFSIASNFLIVEFIPMTMLLAFIAALLGFVAQPLALAAGIAAGIFLGYEIFIINLFSFNWF